MVGEVGRGKAGPVCLANHRAILYHMQSGRKKKRTQVGIHNTIPYQKIIYSMPPGDPKRPCLQGAFRGTSTL